MDKFSSMGAPVGAPARLHTSAHERAGQDPSPSRCGGCRQRWATLAGCACLPRRPLIQINGIGGHLARDHALGEIGTVALQAFEPRCHRPMG